MESLRDLAQNQPHTAETSKPGERVNLELDTTNPQQPKIKLRQQTWAEGMGWFTQKTITLEVAEAAALSKDLDQAVVGAKMARSQKQSRPNPAFAPDRPQEEKVLKFPQERTARKQTDPATHDHEPGKILTFKPGKRRTK